MKWMKRNALLVYLILAFALSWWPWPFKLVNPQSTPMIPYGPIIAAFIAVAIADGRFGVRALLKDMVRWRVGLQWYALALLLPLGVTLAAIYLNSLFGAPVPTAATYADMYLLLPSLLTTTLLGGALTEEPGWRGFALPRLQSKYSALVSSLILGLIWFCWHLPLLLTNDKGGQRPPLQYFITMIGLSIIFTWLYNGTKKSVFMAILLHGAFNTYPAFFFPIQVGDNYARLWWFFALIWSIVALIVTFRTMMVPAQQTTAVRTQAAPDA